MGSYFTGGGAFPGNSTNLSTIVINTPGTYLIRLNVQLQLATSNVSANAYLNVGGVSVGFCMPYSSGNFQAAESTYIVVVSTTYSNTIIINSVTTAIVLTNGIGVSIFVVRIA